LTIPEGQAIIRQHFPDFSAFTETFFITCLLHDIGTTPKNLEATKLSFEFYGGIIALDLLCDKLGAPRSQGESVAETIIRHQDLGETGTVSSLCALIHLVTILGMNYLFRCGCAAEALSGQPFSSLTALD